MNCRPFWFWSWWPTAEHSGSESVANRRPFWLWIYYLGKWKKEEGRRRDGGGCSTVVNRLSVPRPLARRASIFGCLLLLSPPCSCRCVSLTFLVLWIRNHLVIFVLCSPSTEPIFVLIRTHPPGSIHHIPLHNISFYLFIYLSIYLSPFVVQSLFWILLLTTPHFQKTKTHLQINKLSRTVFVSKITFQSLAYIIIVWHRLSDFFSSPSSSLRHLLWHASSSSAALDTKHLSRSLTPHCCSKILLAGKKEASELAFFISVGHTHTYTDHHLSVLLLLQL